ncbi:MAG: phosphate acyltransferase [Bacteroidia bacterium]|nr:phosphate acyltransferase [Bacteroidia bacterium]
MTKINIGLDIAGGDFAPQCNFDGARLILDQLGDRVHLTLIGDQDLIREGLAANGIAPDAVSVFHAPEVIEMGDSPMRALASKPNNSISAGLGLLKAGKIDGFASAGNTGAIFGAAVVALGTVIENIRPCMMAIAPRETGKDAIILDVGASADSKPENLYQFAILGHTFYKYIMGEENPKTGLINIGEEPEKGNEVVKAAYKLMAGSTDFNFIGNVEGNELFGGKADILVCNGFTGNVVLKLCEGWYRTCRRFGLKNDYLEKFNFENQGGSPVLGINGSVVIGHGISNGKAIMNMVKLTAEIVENKLPWRIKEALSNNEQ